MKKKSYERRAYESVDDVIPIPILGYLILKNEQKTKFRQLRVNSFHLFATIFSTK